MIPIEKNQSYWIVRGKTDLRKGMDTLAILLQDMFDQDPFDGAYYFFCDTRSDRFKVLHWDGEGFQLIYKRLENGKLHWPKAGARLTLRRDKRMTGTHQFLGAKRRRK